MIDPILFWGGLWMLLYAWLPWQWALTAYGSFAILVSLIPAPRDQGGR